MNNTILIATIAGLCGMLGWGFGDFFAKKTIDVIGDMATLAWVHVVGVALLIGLCLAKFATLAPGASLHLPTKGSELAGLAFFGALQAIVYFYVYRAFAVGKVSLLNPVFSTYSGLVVILSVIIFGETLHIAQSVLIAIAFVGVLLMSLERDSASLKRFSFTKMHGMSDIVIATLLASVWTLLWARFVSGHDWLVYATGMYLAMFITILIICAIQKIDLKIKNPVLYKFIALIGIGEVVAYAGISRGYSLTSHTSIVAVLSAAFSVPTVLLGRAFLKEKMTVQQIGGVILVIGTGILLAVVS